jgi:tight adherence protein C
MELQPMETYMIAAVAAAAGGAVAFGLLLFLVKRFNARLEDRLFKAVGVTRPAEDATPATVGGILGIFAKLARRLRGGPVGVVLSLFITPQRLKAANRKLEQADMRDLLDPRDLLEARIVGGVVAAAVVLVAGGALTAQNVGFAALVGVVMWRLSMMPVTNATQKRQSRIRGALPKAADIFVVGVEAGLTLDKAVALYCERFRGPLARELLRAQEDIRIGLRRSEAFKAAIDRVGVDDFSRFLGAITLAERFGVPVAMVLRNQSNELKQLRSQRIRENSMKAPIKMLIPTVALIMPALFIILLGPIAIVMATGGLF